MSSRIAPDHDFDGSIAPPAPDYTQAEWWVALPSVSSAAEQMPEGVRREPLGVAVFFVHPTSYFGKESWNQPLSHEQANWVVDERILRHQATVFNSCCDIYAPRYRQATFFSFVDQSDNAEKALALAYSDVRLAFKHFLSEIGPDQPFVVAGHSQGSRHLAKIVREEISGTPTYNRLVAAYLIGFGITENQLGDVEVCQNETQTQCALGWNVMDGKGTGAFGGNDGLVCTNPLNWQANDSYASNDLNKGAIGFGPYNRAGEGEDITAMVVEVGVADAQCQPDGQLAVLNLTSESFPSRMLGNSMHVYDYSLFHANIRENVAARIKAFRP